MSEPFVREDSWKVCEGRACFWREFDAYSGPGNVCGLYFAPEGMVFIEQGEALLNSNLEVVFDAVVAGRRYHRTEISKRKRSRRSMAVQAGKWLRKLVEEGE